MKNFFATQHCQDKQPNQKWAMDLKTLPQRGHRVANKRENMLNITNHQKDAN